MTRVRLFDERKLNSPKAGHALAGTYRDVGVTPRVDPAATVMAHVPAETLTELVARRHPHHVRPGR